MRKGFLVLIAVYIGFCLYCMTIFFYGKSGFFELKKLSEYRDRLEANNSELVEAGESLYREAQKLVSDGEVISLKARELGYLEENQGRITFPGYASREQSYALGKVLKWDEDVKDRSVLFRTVAIGLSLFVSLLFLIAGKQFSRRRD